MLHYFVLVGSAAFYSRTPRHDTIYDTTALAQVFEFPCRNSYTEQFNDRIMDNLINARRLETLYGAIIILVHHTITLT